MSGRERIGRAIAGLALAGLVVWGLALGAWLAVSATVALIGVLARPPARARRIGLVLVGVILTVGAVDTLVAVDRIGARARAGDLDLRDKVAVYGFNAVLAAAAVPAGFVDFAAETLALGIPWSSAGACPEERRVAYGLSGTPRLRRWRSSMPLRSPRIRRVIAGWANRLGPAEPGATRAFARQRIPAWRTERYIAADEANRVPVALNTPHTHVAASAAVVDGRWTLDVVVDLPIAYPPRATLQIGPFGLEEGMFHDARPLLEPYCLEYRFAVDAGDPILSDPEPARGPFESTSTAILRAIGAHYR